MPARGWQRNLLQTETGIAWNNPSPNLRDLEATLLYPAIGLLEATNVSVGRGTDHPFHVLGAPYIDARALMRALRAAALPGVSFAEVEFVPEAAPHRGKTCHGVSATITDPIAFRPVLTGLTLARALWRNHPKEWQSYKLMRLVGSRSVMDALPGRMSLADIESRWQSELDAFKARRARHLLYPDCSPRDPTAPRALDATPVAAPGASPAARSVAGTAVSRPAVAAP